MTTLLLVVALAVFFVALGRDVTPPPLRVPLRRATPIDLVEDALRGVRALAESGERRATRTAAPRRSSAGSLPQQRHGTDQSPKTLR